MLHDLMPDVVVTQRGADPGGDPIEHVDGRAGQRAGPLQEDDHPFPAEPRVGRADDGHAVSLADTRGHRGVVAGAHDVAQAQERGQQAALPLG